MRLYVDPSVTLDTLHDIASDMGIEVTNDADNGIRTRSKYKGKRALGFSLRPDKSQPKVEGTRSKQWQLVRDNPFGGAGMGVRGDGRRNVHAVCWHGHYNFMLRIFNLDATATFATGFDTWAGRNDFLDRAPMSGNANIGSIMYPLQYREACDCDLNGGYILPVDNRPKVHRDIKAFMMKQSDVLACPHVILSPEHYREEDGSCRCNDASHSEMEEWGYVWDGSKWITEPEVCGGTGSHDGQSIDSCDECDSTKETA